MNILQLDVMVPVLTGALIWSVLMIGVQMGEAMTEAVARRRH